MTINNFHQYLPSHEQACKDIEYLSSSAHLTVYGIHQVSLLPAISHRGSRKSQGLTARLTVGSYHFPLVLAIGVFRKAQSIQGLVDWLAVLDMGEHESQVYRVKMRRRCLKQIRIACWPKSITHMLQIPLCPTKQGQVSFYVSARSCFLFFPSFSYEKIDSKNRDKGKN